MLAIIDADMLCYHACQTKRVYKEGEKRLIHLASDGRRMPEQLSKAEMTAALRNSWTAFEKSIDKIMRATFATDSMIAVKSPTNFRNDLFAEYKMNRHAEPSQATAFSVPELRKLVIMQYDGIPAEYCEADDWIGIWSTEAAEAGDPFVICSDDKDLKCLAGLHYNLRSGSITEVTPLEAMRFYYAQLASGDSTDNIPGIPGIGPIKAAALTAKCTTEEECQEAVVGAYFEFYGPDAWLENLLANGKLIHIFRKPGDYFKCRHWPIVQELTI